jgi:hypothetical protein
MAASLAVQAQSVRGTVLDSTTGKPLPGASVFIASSTVGTTTDAGGTFGLSQIPFTRYELVVSYVGFETRSFQLSSADTANLTIQMQPVSDELAAVLITNYEKNGWEHWGFTFRNSFLGTAPIGDKCVIKNPKDLRFSYSKDERILRVVAVNPLIIVNKRLGYQITYDLVEYNNNFKDHTLVSTGYAYFKPLSGSRRQQAQWQNNRKAAFEGSLMQFMRAVYDHNPEKSGFQVRKLVLKPNLEKERVKVIRESLEGKSQTLPADSLAYYQKILAENDAINVLYSGTLPAEKFCFGPAGGVSQLLFDDYLYITYPAKKPAPQYQAVAGYDSCMTALLKMTKHEPVTVTASGSFFDPLNVVVGEYWAWSEKIGSMLPFDYRP